MKLKGKILFILFSIILWTEFNFLGFVYNKRFDVTKFKQHTLTQSTKTIFQGLKQDVKITALHSGIAPKYLEDLLKEYERYAAGKVITEIIDPLGQLSYAAEFGSRIDSRESKAIVQSGSERTDINFTQKSLTEADLTNAILKVTRKPRQVYFLAGHGEYNFHDDRESGLSTFAQMLAANNAHVHELVLVGLEEEIPEDCDLLVVAGPRYFLTPSEEERIRKYLRKGGDALFLIEHTLVTTPDKPLTQEEWEKNPSLNSILNEWGVNIAKDVVVDIASHAGEDVGCPATRNYLPHKALLKDLDYTFYIRPRSIAMVSNRRSTVKVVPFVLTVSDQASWGETDRTLQVKKDEGIDREGPVPIAMVVWESKLENKISETRLIVFTDADFLTNAYISHYSNAQMGLNVIGWLTEMENQLAIVPKAVEVKRLDLTSQQKKTVGMILLAMPLLFTLCGVIHWIFRKA